MTGRIETNPGKQSLIAALRHVVFWTAAYVILLSVFSGSGEWKSIDHIYTIIFMITLMMSVAVNTVVILPVFLNRSKYFWFIFLSFFNIAAFTWFNHILFDKIIDHVLPGYYFISYYTYWDLLKFFIAFAALSTLVELSAEWFQLREARHRLILLEKEKVAAELKAITNQINPHFLFNSLTVLYSLSLKDSRDTSGAILRLSDILRYVLYESSTERVPLKSEITLIENYISLQRYRIHPSTLIEFTTDVDDDNITIAPMLFLPLLENSFKHGVKGDLQNTYVNMLLTSKADKIGLAIRNNKSEQALAVTPGGIGLKSIRDRLELMYPNRHTFVVSETATEFTVTMELITTA